MTNICMLAATRPRLLKQALDSLGDVSNATVSIRDAGMNEEVRDIGHRWYSGAAGALWHRARAPLVGTGPARNYIISISEEKFGRGDYLYLSDDDVYFLQPDWLVTLMTAYSYAFEMGFRIIGCYNHPFNRPIKTYRLPNRWSINEVYALASQSMFMHWSVWDEFGPFCDTPAGKVCQSEDVEMCNRIRATGARVGVISPPLLVNTGITNSFGEHIPGWELVKSQCPEGVICE
jgi:hypothetical protein